MDEREQLRLYDALIAALKTFTGVEQALGHVSDVSSDYEMCQTLSGVLHDEVERVREAFPKCWEEGFSC